MRRRERPVVLVAARDRPVRRLVAAALRSDGFAPTDGRRFRDPAEAVADLHPDAVVVQSGLAEGEGGRALCDQAGAESIPVLWLGGETGPTAAVDALDGAGADDYVAQPFDPAELGARVRALVRRRGLSLAAGSRRIGWSVVDLDRREVRVAGVRHPLGRADWAVLACLLEADGVAVAHEVLLSRAWGSSYRNELPLLRSAIARLRRVLGAAPGAPGPIRTVRGIGYCLESEKLDRT